MNRRTNIHHRKKAKKSNIKSFLSSSIKSKRLKRKLYNFSRRKNLPNFHNKNNTLLAIVLWGLSCVVLFFYSVFFSPKFFIIKNIYIYRNDQISNIDNAYSALAGIRGEKIFKVSKSDIVNRLSANQKNLEFITVSKSLNGDIEIHLDSYAPIFYYNTDFILENGSTAPGNSSLSWSLDIIEIPNFELENRISPQHISNMRNGIDYLEKNILGSQVRSLTYFEVEEEVFYKLSDGSLLIIDLTRSSKEQIEKLAIYHSEFASINEGIFSYIDLRIPGKVISCKKENENQCIENIQYIYNYNIRQDASPE